MANPDIVIVGGGINGCAAAYHLAREGHRVAVVERYRPAAMASGWTLAGVRQSGRDPAELPLARAAVDLWASLDAELGADTGYRREGNLRLARTDSEAEIIHRLVEDQRQDLGWRRVQRGGPVDGGREYEEGSPHRRKL